MHKMHITNGYKHMELYTQAQQHFLQTNNNNKRSNNYKRGINSNNKNEKENGVHIHWNIDKGRNRLQSAAAVEAKGWVGIGIS